MADNASDHNNELSQNQLAIYYEKCNELLNKEKETHNIQYRFSRAYFDNKFIQNNEFAENIFEFNESYFVIKNRSFSQNIQFNDIRSIE